MSSHPFRWFARRTVVINDGAVLELDGKFAFDRSRSITSSDSIRYGRVFITVL